MEWEMNIAPMLEAIERHAACVINDDIFVTGGAVIGAKTINSVQMYSIISNSWSYRAPMIHPRQEHSVNIHKCVFK